MLTDVEPVAMVGSTANIPEESMRLILKTELEPYDKETKVCNAIRKQQKQMPFGCVLQTHRKMKFLIVDYSSIVNIGRGVEVTRHTFNMLKNSIV